MDIVDLLKGWGAILVAALAIGGNIWNWFTAKANNNSQHIAAIEQRLGRVESELQHVPSTEDVHRLQLSVAKLEGSLGTLDERTKGMARAIERIEAFLIKESKS